MIVEGPEVHMGSFTTTRSPPPPTNEVPPPSPMVPSVGAGADRMIEAMRRNTMVANLVKRGTSPRRE